MKHTKGKLTVKPSNAWPFDLVTFDENNNEVFRRGMPAHSSNDKSFDDCINAVNWNHSERDAIKERQIIAYNDERLRAKSPEMLEALKDLQERVIRCRTILEDGHGGNWNILDTKKSESLLKELK